ncbi:TlpA disulfide reductase family protein [Pulveribacter sp.]|uniref:TlpA disulfide reductase family protein n=1 Tax=Pulveribacter sp. TaxID=2678893 RepID=UPI0028A601C1|nr:TlpA disulfide reductase family protein [Pulveribacter sp.]
MLSSPMLVLGPLVLPWAGVIVLAAWLIASTLHDRSARRAGLPPGPHAWVLALLALAAARLGFVLQYGREYAGAPWTALDIRDGGWSAGWGLLAGALYVLALWLRRNPWRRPVALAATVGAGLWLAGSGALQLAQPAAPTALPAWQGVALDARTVQLPALQGRPVVINLWASWCPPCRREMPVLLRARADNPEVRFLWVNQGEAPETVVGFAAAQQLPQADVVLDQSSQLGALLGHRALPTTLFYDARGALVAVRSGELSAATLAQHLRLTAQPLSKE